MKYTIASLFIFLLFFQTIYAQQTTVANFKKADVAITINPYEKSVEGGVTYTFDVLQKTDSIFLNAQHISFSEVKLNGKKVKYVVNDSVLILHKKLKPTTNNTLSFVYKATPRKTMYFFGWEYPNAQQQVWTQGQGKYTSNWLPSFDDVNEKVVFNLSVSFPAGYEVVANGVLAAKKDIANNYTQWVYTMQNPMSSYLVAIAAGKYAYEKRVAASGKEMLLYYYPEAKDKLTPTYEYSTAIFDFLEEEIGVPFAWGNYKQIPVRDFMYGGMENTTATIFNDSYYIDAIAFNDRNYVNVNAHELAHHWFGDLITEATPTDHWLQEGFATYYALLAEKHIFGDAYFKAALFDTAMQLYAQSKEGKGEALLNAHAGSLTFYQKGAWALVALENLVGHEAFKKGVKNYLEQYKFKNVTTTNFLDAIQEASGVDVATFKKTWLQGTEFPYEEAMALLADSPNGLPELINNKFKDTVAAKPTTAIKQLWTSLPDAYKERIVSYRKSALVDTFYVNNILNNGSLKVRQAFILQTDKIPAEWEEKFKTFLDDESYITVENVLYKLWAYFPENRNVYLDKTATIKGFNDLNVRILWLALALATPNYKTLEKHGYFEELTGYASAIYGYDVREKAFGFINELDAYSNDNLKDLVNGCMHPSWRFASNCRSLLTHLLEDSVYKERFEEVMPELTEREQKFLKSKL